MTTTLARYAVGVAAALIAAGAGLGCAPTSGTASGSARRAASARGALTVRDVRGRKLHIGARRDKVVLLVFWSSWCTRCFGKLRFLDKLYRDNKQRGFHLIGAAMDQPDTRARVRPAIKRYRLRFPTFIDAQGRAVQRYNPRRIQTFGVLMKKGRVVQRFSPIQTSDLSAIKARVLALLR